MSKYFCEDSGIEFETADQQAVDLQIERGIYFDLDTNIDRILSKQFQSLLTDKHYY